ncbi:MAG: CBS domain-containing protein, partial [Tardiphaga sp.]
MRAHQIMTRDVITIGPETKIVEAANLMLQNHISGLPVVGPDGELLGIVSEADFLRRAEIGTQRQRGRLLRFLLGPGDAAANFVRAQGRKVSEIMTPDPLTVTEDTSLQDIVQMMEKNHV